MLARPRLVGSNGRIMHQPRRCFDRACGHQYNSQRLNSNITNANGLGIEHALETESRDLSNFRHRLRVRVFLLFFTIFFWLCGTPVLPLDLRLQ